MVVRRTVLAGLLANALLMSAGCDGGDQPPPGANDVDALVEAAEEFDPEATFRRPQSFEPDVPVGDETELDSETSLRDQSELAIARLEDESCSPQDAERLRDAIGD